MKEQIICWFEKGKSFYVLLRVDIKLKGEEFDGDFEVQVIGESFLKRPVHSDSRLQSKGFRTQVRQNIKTWLTVFEADVANNNGSLITFIKENYPKCLEDNFFFRSSAPRGNS